MSVPVYVVPDRRLNSFCIGVYLRAGSMYEPNELNGITHLYEHAVFRNIKKKYEGDFYELLTENALTFNASTYKEFVYFEIMGTPSGVPFAADIVKRLFDPIELTYEEYSTEKKRIKAEIREESEFTSLQYYAEGKVWENTSLSNTISGYCKTVDKISLKRLNEYRKTVVNEENVFVFVTGNVSENDVERIKAASSAMKVSKGGVLRDNTAPVPESFGKRAKEIYVKQSDYCLVRMSFDVDNGRCPDAVRDVIYSALFEGEDAVLFQRMSEREPLVYSYDSTLEQYRNVSCIKLQYEISHKNLERSFEAVTEILDDLKNGNFRFDNAKKKLFTKWELMRDETANFNWALAYTNHILGGSGIDINSKKTSLYEDVTLDSVCDAAKQIFTRNNLVCALKGNKKSIDTDALNNILDRLD